MYRELGGWIFVTVIWNNISEQITDASASQIL